MSHTNARKIMAAEREHRALMARYGYPLPPPGDAYVFAASELGEGGDALERMKPEYARNTQRTVSLPMELGDFVAMLATAAIQIEDGVVEPRDDKAMQFACVMEQASWAMWSYANGNQEEALGWTLNAMESAGVLAEMHGIDITEAYKMSRGKQEQRWAK